LGSYLLGGEYALDRGQERVPVQQLEIARQLLDAVDLTSALDLDGDAHAVGSPAHDVDGPDRRRVLAAHQPPAVAEYVQLDREQFLQMCLDAILDQARIYPQVNG